MRTTFFVLIFLCTSFWSTAQTLIYKGFVDVYPIELYLDGYNGEIDNAMYVYTKYDTPIALAIKYEDNKLVLLESNGEGKAPNRIEFANFSAKAQKLSGQWIRADKLKTLNIKLDQHTSFAAYDDTSFKGYELLQLNTLDKHYFKVILNKEAGDDARVYGLKIYEKRTDKLIQSFEKYCIYREFESINTGDFNFDGYMDFSLFESFYAGPNTTSIYYLLDPTTGNYFDSGFEGTSLEFNAETKTVHLHDQCCAGRYIRTATFKIVNNKMEMIAEQCLEYQDGKDELVEVDCE